MEFYFSNSEIITTMIVALGVIVFGGVFYYTLR
jgi:hypothetical protein